MSERTAYGGRLIRLRRSADPVRSWAVLWLGTKLLGLAAHFRNMYTLELKWYQRNSGRITASARHGIGSSGYTDVNKTTHLQTPHSSGNILWNTYLVARNFGLHAKMKIVLYIVIRPKAQG
jgi:hypothetical protein